MKKKILTLDDYQFAANRTAIYPNKGANLIYTVLGLAGEAGELANKVKKLMRSAGLKPGMSIGELYYNITCIKDNKIKKQMLKIFNGLNGELGGILWYVSACTAELGIVLNKVGIDNIDELSARVKNNSVEGNGDER